MVDGQAIITWILIFLTFLFFAIPALVALTNWLRRNRKKKSSTVYLTNKQSEDVQIKNIGNVQLIEKNQTITSVETLLSRRFEEAQDALRQYQDDEKINGIANILMVFGQSIIGAILTVSFVQTSLSQQNLGIIGLLVLLATLLRQIYRPDEKGRSAKKRVVYLKWLIRKTENLMALSDDKLTMSILEDLTQGLNKVDQEEEWEKEEHKKN